MLKLVENYERLKKLQSVMKERNKFSSEFLHNTQDESHGGNAVTVIAKMVKSIAKCVRRISR